MNIENSIQTIYNYNPKEYNITPQVKKNIRLEINLLTKSNLKPDFELKSRIEEISKFEDQNRFALTKVLHYTSHLFSFGYYESQYIASSKLRYAADNFLKNHYLNENIARYHPYSGFVQWSKFRPNSKLYPFTIGDVDLNINFIPH
ncbi:MAG: hypothetical protein WD595_02855 [Waddliaceae bacterium]